MEKMFNVCSFHLHDCVTPRFEAEYYILADVLVDRRDFPRVKRSGANHLSCSVAGREMFSGATGVRLKTHGQRSLHASAL